MDQHEAAEAGVMLKSAPWQAFVRWLKHEEVATGEYIDTSVPRSMEEQLLRERAFGEKHCLRTLVERFHDQVQTDKETKENDPTE